jgi:hypothetical protein
MNHFDIANQDLIAACISGDAVSAEDALQRGAHPEGIVDAMNPLAVAAKHRSYAVIAVLIKRGAHINANLQSPYKDPSDYNDGIGMTPVAYALDDPDTLTVMLAESGSAVHLGREAEPDHDEARGVRFMDLIKVKDQGAIYRILALHFGSKAEKAVLKMRSEEIIANAGGEFPFGPSANN